MEGWLNLILALIVQSILKNSVNCVENDPYMEYGGQNVRHEDEFPWACQIFKKGRMESSAMILNENTVVTAGHVFPCGSGYDLADFKIVVGWHRNENQTLSIAKVVRPPGYDLNEGAAGDADIAFIRTTSTIEIPKQDGFVSLPTPNITFDSLVNTNEKVTFYGWGKIADGESGPIFPSTAKKIRLDLTTADAILMNEGIDSKFGSIIQPEAGFICKGDSGGPAVVDIKGRLFIIGVLISGPDSLCEPRNARAYNIFTNMSSYMEVFKNLENSDSDSSHVGRVWFVFVGMIVGLTTSIVINLAYRYFNNRTVRVVSRNTRDTSESISLQ